MKDLQFIAYIIFLAIILCIVVFTIIYEKEVRKAKNETGFPIPVSIQMFLRANLVIATTSAILILIFIFTS